MSPQAELTAPSVRRPLAFLVNAAGPPAFLSDALAGWEICGFPTLDDAPLGDPTLLLLVERRSGPGGPEGGRAALLRSARQAARRFPSVRRAAVLQGAALAADLLALVNEGSVTFVLDEGTPGDTVRELLDSAQVEHGQRLAAADLRRRVQQEATELRTGSRKMAAALEEMRGRVGELEASLARTRSLLADVSGNVPDATSHRILYEAKRARRFERALVVLSFTAAPGDRLLPEDIVGHVRDVDWVGASDAGAVIVILPECPPAHSSSVVERVRGQLGDRAHGFNAFILGDERPEAFVEQIRARTSRR